VEWRLFARACLRFTWQREMVKNTGNAKALKQVGDNKKLKQ
jgi:hypothetical protein